MGGKNRGGLHDITLPTEGRYILSKVAYKSYSPFFFIPFGDRGIERSLPIPFGDKKEGRYILSKVAYKSGAFISKVGNVNPPCFYRVG